MAALEEEESKEDWFTKDTVDVSGTLPSDRDWCRRVVVELARVLVAMPVAAC